MTKERVVKERPILMSGPMVQACLEDRKSMTRRIIKAPEDWGGPIAVEWYEPAITDKSGDMRDGPEIFGAYSEDWGVACPYGGPGDRLWVREKWCIVSDGALDYPTVDYFQPRESRQLYRWESGYRFKDNRNGLIWKEDLQKAFGKGDKGWSPSIHMPRWASRLTLEIESVRVEQVQDIDADDVDAEGVPESEWSHVDGWRRNEFAALWDQINGKGAWERNDWVWVISFKRLEKSP